MSSRGQGGIRARSSGANTGDPIVERADDGSSGTDDGDEADDVRAGTELTRQEGAGSGLTAGRQTSGKTANAAAARTAASPSGGGRATTSSRWRVGVGISPSPRAGTSSPYLGQTYILAITVDDESDRWSHITPRMIMDQLREWIAYDDDGRFIVIIIIIIQS